VIRSPPARTRRSASGSSLTTRRGGERELLAVDLERPAAREDDHDLLLLRGGLVVLGPLGAGAELEPVEAERGRADRAAQEPHAASMRGAYGTAARRRTLARMEPFAWDAAPVEQLNDRIGRQMLNGDALTLARIILASGAVVPEHSHDNEQIATVVSGRLRFWLDGEETVLPPRREDWIRGDDAYLRG
jgi:unsaturated pyranuronate lyase